jgi:hypothetical protein
MVCGVAQVLRIELKIPSFIIPVQVRLRRGFRSHFYRELQKLQTRHNLENGKMKMP